MYLHKLNYINKLNLSRNLISDSKFLANESDHPYLLILNLANNKINELGAIGFCKLKHLNLNSNLIVTLEYFEGHTCLEVLELRGNKIHSLKGLRKVIRLTALYLADNQISNLEGLADLPKLERLHLRKNKLNELIVFP